MSSSSTEQIENPEIIEHELANGLKVLTKEVHTAPVVSTYIWYKVGARNEQLGITGDYRIAWVELNPKAFDAVYFVETVLVNRGYMARLFSDVDEAKEWLFVDS